MSPSPGPTVILIGGQMTVDDGTSFDTRQKIEGDENSEVTLRSLATSPLWWSTTISVVMPILDGAGEEAFALVIGQRSVVELRQDGSTKRTSLRSFLPGGTSRAEIVRSQRGKPIPDGFEAAAVLHNWDKAEMGTIGVKRGESGHRWRFLQGNEYYLTQAGQTIGPAVIVDTTPWVLPEKFHAYHLQAMEASRFPSTEAVLVAPHTFGADQYFKAYEEWVSRGRPPDSVSESPPINSWDPDARPDPVHYATPVPISATFGITGLVVAAQWQDAADLEAARALLEARYDLKLGIWDLASNPTLRKTLLDTSPVQLAPPVAVPIPQAAERRAEARVDAKLHAKEVERTTLTAVTERLGPLKELGWARRAEKQRGLLQLPLTEPMQRWTDDEPFPLVLLALDIAKRSTEVTGFTIMYNQVDLGTYVEERRSVLEDIAAPAECKLGSGWTGLWRTSGGWGDDIDWEDRARLLAALTPRWIEVFSPLTEECRRVRLASGLPPQ